MTRSASRGHHSSKELRPDQDGLESPSGPELPAGPWSGLQPRALLVSTHQRRRSLPEEAWPTRGGGANKRRWRLEPDTLMVQSHQSPVTLQIKKNVYNHLVLYQVHRDQSPSVLQSPSGPSPSGPESIRTRSIRTSIHLVQVHHDQVLLSSGRGAGGGSLSQVSTPSHGKGPMT